MAGALCGYQYLRHYHSSGWVLCHWMHECNKKVNKIDAFVYVGCIMIHQRRVAKKRMANSSRIPSSKRNVASVQGPWDEQAFLTYTF